MKNDMDIESKIDMENESNLRIDVEESSVTNGFNNIIEILKYAVIGVSSSIVQYVVYSLLYKRTGNLFFANTVAYIISVFNSYFWNRRIVFHSDETAVWWKVLIKNYMLYFGTGVVCTNILSYLMIKKWNVSPDVSPIIIILLMCPANYLLNKFWAHKGEL